MLYRKRGESVIICFDFFTGYDTIIKYFDDKSNFDDVGGYMRLEEWMETLPSEEKQIVKKIVSWASKQPNPEKYIDVLIYGTDEEYNAVFTDELRKKILAQGNIE